MKKKLLAIVLVGLLAVSLNSSVGLAENVAVPNQLGVDLDGKSFTLEDHLGKKNLYLVFWATWCAICKVELPKLTNVYHTVKEVEVVAINPGINDSLERTRHFVKEYNLPYQVIFDETTLSAQAFGIVGVPTAILINKNGEIVYAGYPLPAEEVAKIIS